MGEVFAGRYELVDVLGRGGMGDVWRAWDRRERRYTAAKRLRQVDSVSVLRFVREASWRIEHPHVVVPTEWVGADDVVLLTMPIVEGGSVATVLADHGTVPWSWAEPVLEQVLDALAAVHAAGLVHRDVKPANLLLAATGTGEPHVYLSDFGIAVHVDEPRLTRSSEQIGTRGYLAPELALGADPHPTQDLYAVGVLAREMLGSVPTGTVLERLLATTPDDRPGSAAEAREALAQVGPLEADGADAFDPEPVEVFGHVPTLPPGWGADGPERRGRVPTDLLVAALLALVGLALLTTAIGLL